jgi:hypothetical protein
LGAPLRGANLDLDHRLADHASAIERPQGQVDDGSVATHAADVAGFPERFSMELWQAVDEAGQPLGGRVLPAVPARIVGRVVEAEIGAQVHDSPGDGGKLLDTRGHLAVGKGSEEHVARLQFLQAHQVKVCPPPEVGVQEVGRLASAALRGSLLHLYPRMIQQQP